MPRNNATVVINFIIYIMSCSFYRQHTSYTGQCNVITDVCHSVPEKAPEKADLPEKADIPEKADPLQAGSMRPTGMYTCYSWVSV